MSVIKRIWKCILSPRLFKIYEITSMGHLVDKSYEPNNIERWSDKIVTSFAAVWSGLGLYVIPIVAAVMYQSSSTLVDNIYSLSKTIIWVGMILCATLLARGCSRANNPLYVKFLKTLIEANAHYNAETRQELHKYNFEFWAWPVDYKMSDIEGEKPREKLTLEKIASASGRIRRKSGKDYIFALPCKLLSYVVAHTFAIKIIYPGAVSIINWVLSARLMAGRTDLIKQGGERFKLTTADDNAIDVIFVDQRNKETNGNMLVVICEGNCSYYESGMISTPLSKGYSVLGWNHPGFGDSTGTPYPAQEENAVDCVMRFAIDHLGFQEKQIILYGWSIGGYTATWAAMNYPVIHSLVLDATFDDVLPLAIMAMSSLIEGLVRNVIRDYFNLNIAEQLNSYNGTLLIVRRTEDEIICAPKNTLAGNRGNMLLTKLLLRRYPHLFSDTPECGLLLTTFLAAEVPDRRSILEAVKVEESNCLRLIAKDIEKTNGSISYPSTVGQNCDSNTKQRLVLFLATMYMKDQPASHCVPLAVDLFHPGWDPVSAASVK